MLPFRTNNSYQIGCSLLSYLYSSTSSIPICCPTIHTNTSPPTSDSIPRYTNCSNDILAANISPTSKHYLSSNTASKWIQHKCDTTSHSRVHKTKISHQRHSFYHRNSEAMHSLLSSWGSETISSSQDHSHSREQYHNFEIHNADDTNLLGSHDHSSNPSSSGDTIYPYPSMNILLWNSRGACSNDLLLCFKDLLSLHKPNIVILTH